MVVVRRKKGRIRLSVELSSLNTKAPILLTLLLSGCANLTASIHDGSNRDNDGAKAPRVIWSASAKLESVNGIPGEAGFIEVTAYDDNTVIPTIRLHLPELIEGRYEAWIATDEIGERVNLGPLIQADHGGYRLRKTTITITKDFDRYRTVLITNETGKNEASSPSRALLRGTLKVVSGLNIRGEKALLWMPSRAEPR